MSDPVVAPVSADPSATVPAAPAAPVAATPPAPVAPVAAPVPVAPAATVVAPAAPVAPPAAPAAPPAPADSKWLAQRLEGAKKTAQTALLSELGFASIDAAKAAAAEAKAKADAGKTAEQRAAELTAQLTTVQTQAERHAAIIQEHSARMLMVLSPAHQELVKSFAGDDPALTLATIQKLTDAGVLSLEDEPAPPAAPPPANTAPPPTAPGGTTVSSPPDHKAQYESLKQSNPFRAAAYGAQHPSIYQPKG